MNEHDDGDNRDPIDQATRLTERINQSQLNNHRNRPLETALVIEGVRCCVDCEAVIDSDRLTYVPHAVRCVSCQNAHEGVNKHYGKLL